MEFINSRTKSFPRLDNEMKLASAHNQPQLLPRRNSVSNIMNPFPSQAHQFSRAQTQSQQLIYIRQPPQVRNYKELFVQKVGPHSSRERLQHILHDSQHKKSLNWAAVKEDHV